MPVLSTMDYQSIYIVLTTLAFSAFFSGMEIAFISADKLHIELQRQQGTLPGKLLSYFLQKPSQFIGTTLIGNTLALVVYGIFMAKLLEPLLIALLPESLHNDFLILVTQTILSTLLVLITAEFTPKSVFLSDPNALLSLFALPMTVIYYVMYPVVSAIVWLSKYTIVHVLRLDYSEDKPVFGLTDLNNFIKNTLNIHYADEDTQDRSVTRLDTKIFNNALEFKTIKVRECMIPRTEVVAIDVNDTIDDLKLAFIESGHSKIIIYRDSIDEVIGYTHSQELFKKPKTIQEILTPIIIVPETMPANELLIQFITERKSLSLVVDEFGGTAGIVSIEDIIEEIFGDIQDEHDDEDWIEQKLNEHTYLFSARHEIDYLNEKYKWAIPTGDYDTLGGYILSITEDIPTSGEVIKAYPFTFTIMAMRENRIDNVKLTVSEENED